MITYWQQENGRFVKTEWDERDKSQNTWVDARSVTREDIRILQEDFGVEQDNILDILDPDELSRIDKEDNYTITIARIPVFDPTGDISYFTAPIGVIVYPDIVITICWTDCEMLRDITANRIRGISLADFPAFIVKILSRADIMFLRYLKEINRRTSSIQHELQQSIKNNELIQLLNLEKSLEFFSTSLKSNQILLEKLKKTKCLTFDANDFDWLDDVVIDNRQAIEMTDTYSNILAGTMDAFASVISNNMNIVMKKLTIISLVMMVPTFITGFFGMNVKLPFSESEWMGTAIISVLCVASSLIAALLLVKKRTDLVTKRQKKSLTQKIKEKKALRALKAQEKKIERS